MTTISGHELFAKIQSVLGPEVRRHKGVDAPGRRDQAIAGGSYRAIGALVDGYRAGDADMPVKGVVVAARASTAVLERAAELGANIVISRSAFLGDSQDRPVTRPEPALAAKLDLINRQGLAVLRLQDPRGGALGLEVTTAFPRVLGLEGPVAELDSAVGLVYRNSPLSVLDVVRRAKEALQTQTVRLVGDPSLSASGIAIATETNRPNALAPLISRPDVNLLVCGEVHETETTAYVMDAIALGQPKAMLVVGSIAMEEPAAKVLAQQVAKMVDVPVTYLPTNEGLLEVA
ncbi:MAG: Nif3-like dinuclear metal center hexameric protein [Porphyrobacter sp.]|nr:Nif3-like dinuclear metal center hexameric protein [Porphyrobacter sp.]